MSELDQGHVTPQGGQTGQFMMFSTIVFAIAVAVGLPLLWNTVLADFELPSMDRVARSTIASPAHLNSLVRGATELLTSPLFYLIIISVFVAENYIPADRNQRLLSRGFIQDFGAWFLLDAPLRGAVSGVILGGTYLFLDSHLSDVRMSDSLAARIPVAMRVLAALVIADLMKWVHHVLAHKFKWMWFFHSVHHSQREMNFFSDLRFHAVESVTLLPILYTPLYILNLDFEAVILTLLLIQWYPRVYHANLRTNFGPLRYVLVTPQSHRIHHSCEPQHLDRNFGSIFSFWDRLFGTQWTNYDEYPKTGITDESFPWEASVQGTNLLANYFAQLVYPFRQLIRALRSDP